MWDYTETVLAGTKHKINVLRMQLVAHIIYPSFCEHENSFSVPIVKVYRQLKDGFVHIIKENNY